ncbi:uncharacterized protein PAC_02549 [Phialocephala subalpina]|uniref:Uncharacterized protein n=1 Tax=Phialocephala subalpina TaxID=576137 RepID=A0A1L7WIS2_9HELO|nr:uncharacterized protein PAC_02549 [Phialocephala subalpina]
MRTLNVVLALGALLPLSSAMFSIRALNDPVQQYLTRMCYPLFSNATRQASLQLTALTSVSSLANSPFPCEQSLYLRQVCTANGTTANDFLAEQQCLCNGSYFTAHAGCDDCYLAHGYQDYTAEESTRNISSLSVAECAPTPPFQPFSNLVSSVNITSQSLSPSLTLGDDRFPNMTAVSNYFTETASATPGSITGSATARLTSWTNYSGIRYTPTSIPPNSGTGSATVASGITPTLVGTSKSTGAAATRGVGIVGGILAAGVGVVAML